MSSPKNFKTYDKTQSILLGNFESNVDEYKDQFQSYKLLSPYYPYQIKVNNKTFPSIINYIYHERLCIRDIKNKLQTLDPQEVKEYYRKNRNRCNKIFKQLGEKIGISKYENVNNYLYKITQNSLNILYQIFTENSVLKEALLSTRNYPIFFLDSDEVLGEGARDGSGMNLYGKMLEQVRTFIQQNTLTTAVSYRYLKNLYKIDLTGESYEDYLEYKNEKFNKLESWAYKMLLMYCNGISQLFNYLCIPRKDFLPINTTSNITIKNDTFILQGKYENLTYQFKKLEGKYSNNILSGEGWKFPKSSIEQVKQLLATTSLYAIKPVITPEIVRYVTNDIFNCSFKSKYNNVYFPEPSSELINVIKNMIITNISESDVKLNTTMTNQACNLLWLHICMLSENIIENTFSDFQEGEDITKIKEILTKSRSSVDTIKREFIDHGLPTESENCALQSAIYVIVALTDWLGVDVVGEEEVNTFYNIVGFNIGRSFIKNMSSNQNYIDIVKRAFYNKGLLINTNACKYIADFVETLNDRMKKSKKFVNRIMFFSNII